MSDRHPITGLPLGRPSDVEYFAERGRDERARAEACRDADIAAVHLELAAKYDELVAHLQASGPIKPN
jgi:hypothetical protein